MAETPYEDGRQDGTAIAEHHFSMWQDAKGPPFPWPTATSAVQGFVEDCFPLAMRAVLSSFAQQARAAGMDPEYLPIRRDLMKGIEDGYRARLTELLHGFVKQHNKGDTSMTSSISVTIVPPHVSPVGSFMIVKAFVPTREQGLAKIDGTFTSGFMRMEEDVVWFDSAEDAIAWAEAAPRFWTAINKSMFR